MIKPGVAATKVIKFNRIESGLYRSNAYDGFGKMIHSYEISRNSRDGWTLLVDGQHYGPYGGYGTKQGAVDAATRIERGEGV